MGLIVRCLKRTCGEANFTIDVIDVFAKHFNRYVSKKCLGYGNTFEWYVSKAYYIGHESIRGVRIALMTDIIDIYGEDVELTFTITVDEQYA